jgi:arsenate reductase
LTIETLERSHLPTSVLRSKSWDEFSRPGAPKLDFVFTVCSNAAQEQCPYWPGQPMTAHWGIDDPALVAGTREDQERAFRRALRELDARLKLFINLPFEKLDRMALQQRLRDIGSSTAETTESPGTAQPRS